MNKVSFLFVLLLISCDLVNKFRENKRDFETQIDTKQETSEQALRKRLSESQNKGLDFLKEVLKGKESRFNFILNFGEDKLDKFKLALDHIQESFVNCHDSKDPNDSHDGHGDNLKKELFERLVVQYVSEQIGLLKYHNNDVPMPEHSNPLKNMCIR